MLCHHPQRSGRLPSLPTRGLRKTRPLLGERRQDLPAASPLLDLGQKSLLHLDLGRARRRLAGSTLLLRHRGNENAPLPSHPWQNACSTRPMILVIDRGRSVLLHRNGGSAPRRGMTRRLVPATRVNLTNADVRTTTPRAIRIVGRMQGRGSISSCHKLCTSSTYLVYPYSKLYPSFMSLRGGHCHQFHELTRQDD